MAFAEIANVLVGGPLLGATSLEPIAVTLDPGDAVAVLPDGSTIPIAPASITATIDATVINMTEAMAPAGAAAVIVRISDQSDPKVFQDVGFVESIDTTSFRKGEIQEGQEVNTAGVDVPGSSTRVRVS